MMKEYELIGIGAGPANLSLAALTQKANIEAIFFDKQEDFSWHPGMLLPDAKLQVSFLKDLVTLVDPTNEYSFLNFLMHKESLYQFITANFPQISRLEFNQYLRWVFHRLPIVSKGEPVFEVEFNGELLVIKTSKGLYHTKNLVLGTGLTPYVPLACINAIGSDVYHNNDFMLKNDSFAGKRVAIIGGGQSGAEIVCNLLSEKNNIPDSIVWISKRLNFLPIDDSPFTNELFTPQYAKYFYQLNTEKKDTLLLDHKLASDGISQHTIEKIYRKLYEHRFINQKAEGFKLLPAHRLCSIIKNIDHYQLDVIDSESDRMKKITADKVILCTGYQYQEPELLSKIKPLFNYDDRGLVISDTYQVNWRGSGVCSIYIQNGARHTHGVADPNLSLLAYRSALILNDILGYELYPKTHGSRLINWD